MKKNRSIYEIEVSQKLKKLGIGFEEEFRFDKRRRFRFDFVLKPVKTKIAVELEGGQWMGNSRHGFGKGFENDCLKYNLAALQGWLILRYTPSLIPQIFKDLKTLKIIKYEKRRNSNKLEK